MRPFALLLCSVVSAAAQVSFTAPSSVPAGAEFSAAFSGTPAEKDYLAISEKGSGDRNYVTYKYFRTGNPIPMRTPDDPGEYELRHMTDDYKVVSRKPLVVTPVTAEVTAPDSVAAGSDFQVSWTGPDHPKDFVTIVQKGTPERQYKGYFYTKAGNPGKLRAPDEAGDYEIRYLTGQKYYTLASAAIVVTANSASLQAPSQLAAGVPIEIQWSGPNNPRDFITIVPAGAPDRKYDAYVYVDRGNPAKMEVPTEPGQYEIRYLTGQTYATLASIPLTIGDVSATVTAPAEVTGGETFEVAWTGPDNRQDYITITTAGADPGDYGPYQYTTRGTPVRLRAPLEDGEYEVRYQMRGDRILARQPIRVGPPKHVPGKLRVVSSAATGGGVAAGSGGAVEIILDASGSMLQRLGSERRIEIAKRTLTKLVTQTVPAGTPFALRVFGHKETDSCRTDLEIPLAPLDPAKVKLQIAGINAVNLAKTPIAESLKQTLSDLGSAAKGQRLIVLITDGEETCDGDPAAAIEALRAAGVDVRVNIVGFAIDDAALEETFRYWADLGDGSYFSASDAAGLDSALGEAMRAPFEALDAAGQVVATGIVGGPEVSPPAGILRGADEGILRRRSCPGSWSLRERRPWRRSSNGLFGD